MAHGGRWTATFDEGRDFHGFALEWTVQAPDGEAHYGWSEHNAKAIVEAFANVERLVAALDTLLEWVERGDQPERYREITDQAAIALASFDIAQRHRTPPSSAATVGVFRDGIIVDQVPLADRIVVDDMGIGRSVRG